MLRDDENGEWIRLKDLLEWVTPSTDVMVEYIQKTPDELKGGGGDI